MVKKTIIFKDSTIYYELTLKDYSETIVFLHPYGSSINIFKNQIEYFKRKYNLLLIDMPSHGRSSYSSLVTIKDMPEIIKTVLNENNISKVHLLGIKEGALVAQAFMSVFSKNVLSLVLVSSYSIFENDYKVIRGTNILNNIKMKLQWLFYFKGYKNSLINNSAISDDGRDLFKESMLNFKRRSIFFKKGIKRFYKLINKEVSIPIYLVVGSLDKEIIKDLSIKFEKRYQRVILEGFHGCKEVVFLDNNKLFNERLMTFLSYLGK